MVIRFHKAAALAVVVAGLINTGHAVIEDKTSRPHNQQTNGLRIRIPAQPNISWTAKKKAAVALATVSVLSAAGLAYFAYKNPESTIGIAARAGINGTTAALNKAGCYLGSWFQAAKALVAQAPATAASVMTEVKTTVQNNTPKGIADRHVLEELKALVKAAKEAAPGAPHVATKVAQELSPATKAWIESWKTTPTYVGRVIAEPAAQIAQKAAPAAPRDWHIPGVRSFVKAMRNQFNK